LPRFRVQPWASC